MDSFFDSISGAFDALFTPLTRGLEAFLFYPVPFPYAPDGMPLLVLWLVVAGIFFTFRLGCANLRLLPHAFAVVAGKYDHANAEGEITSRQALLAALSGTIGLGNIAGVAVGISLGGPGAVVWMVIAAFFGTATKLAEVTIGHRYRVRDEHGNVSGGAFHYLTDGLARQGKAKLGKTLAILFSICCIGGTLGGGNMLQSNQAVATLTGTFAPLAGAEGVLSLLLAVSVAVILIGGIRRIVKVTDKLVPFMVLIYVSACIAVLVVNAALIPDALALMLHEAFTPEAAGGGMMGALIMGFRRAFFSNEAGVGSTPIAHAASKNPEPVREGCVALLEPIFDTVLVCTMTGLVIVTTGVYQDSANGEGVALTSAAFRTVISWFPEVLAVCVFLFAYSTMLTWSYYGERAWHYLFGARFVKLYYLLFATLTFFGGLTDLGVIVDFGDLVLLAMAIPNLIGLYLMSGELRREVESYRTRLKAGEFK